MLNSIDNNQTRRSAQSPNPCITFTYRARSKIVATILSFLISSHLARSARSGAFHSLLCRRSGTSRAMRLVNHPFRLDSQQLLSYLTSTRVLTFAVTPANSTTFWNAPHFCKFFGLRWEFPKSEAKTSDINNLVFLACI